MGTNTIIGLVISAIIVYMISDWRYDAGKLAGVKEAQQACVDKVAEAIRNRDKEHEVEALTQLEDLRKRNEARIKYMTEIATDEQKTLRDSLDRVSGDRDRLVIRLRDAKAAARSTAGVRNQPSGSGIDRTSDASGSGAADESKTGRVLSEQAELDLVDALTEADRINVNYATVYRAYRDVKTGKVITEAPP